MRDNEPTGIDLLMEVLDNEIPDGWSITLHCGASEDRYIVIELPVQGLGTRRVSLSIDDAIGLASTLLMMAGRKFDIALLSRMAFAYDAIGSDVPAHGTDTDSE